MRERRDALLPHTGHSVVRRPCVVSKVAVPKGKGERVNSERACAPPPRMEFNKDGQFAAQIKQISSTGGDRSARAHAHVAEVGSELHRCAAVQLLPHVAAEVVRGRVQVQPVESKSSKIGLKCLEGCSGGCCDAQEGGTWSAGRGAP